MKTGEVETQFNMLDRFAKIEVVALRHQLNCKKNKIDEFPRKPRAFSARELLGCLAVAGVSNNECIDDSRKMSNSLIGGHVNVCKIRVVNLQPAMQGQIRVIFVGNMFPESVRKRLILSEKPNDGTVAMHYGDLSDADYLNAEDYLPTLPNTQWADLLAAQFCTLVIREGYVIDEVVHPRPQQCSEPIEIKATVPNPVNSTAGMNSPGNSQMSVEQMSAGVTMPARPQQMDPQQRLQQHLPHQQSQLAQMQRRMVMGLGTAMGMGNNMGLGGLSTAEMSAAMGPMSGMGGVGQNPNRLRYHLQARALNPQGLAAAQRLMMMQNRGMSPQQVSSEIRLSQANILSQQQLQLLHQMKQQQSQSSLQSVLSPQQVSSSSTMRFLQHLNRQFTPQQHASPQQMAQRTPMSPPVSSGPVHPMSASNSEGYPASPALSSQTLCSVGRITNTNGLAGSE